LLKIKILGIGKNKDRFIEDGCSHYSKLLSRYAKVEFDFLTSSASSTSLSPAEIKAREADQILARLEKEKGFRIALDNSARQLNTETFASEIEKWQAHSQGAMMFVIGGAYGLDSSVTEMAEISLSLSPLTFSHQLVRLALLEQLYRCFSILHGTSYHK